MNECRLRDIRQQVIAIRGQNAHTAVDRDQDAQLLGDRLASEAARILDDHATLVAMYFVQKSVAERAGRSVV